MNELYYQVLGLREDCTRAELQEAYEERAQAWAPENFSGNEQLRARAAEKLKHIQDAHDFLQARFAAAPPGPAAAPVNAKTVSMAPPPVTRKTRWGILVVMALLVAGAIAALFWLTEW